MQDQEPPADELLFVLARQDIEAAVEAERRRLALLLERQVTDPLHLLVAQANVYEQTLGSNPAARLALSVLASLARQALQQVRDLEENLRPGVLDSLGLEPALESLAGQVQRTHGLRVELVLERLRERLPPTLERALYRIVQEALERATHTAHASRVFIRLTCRPGELAFAITDDGLPMTGSDIPSLSAACTRVTRLGGRVAWRAGASSGMELVITMPLDNPVQLTEREREVVELLAEGLSNKEIARRLALSPRTVNFHLDNLYAKLGVHSRTEAAIHALRRGWVWPEKG